MAFRLRFGALLASLVLAPLAPAQARNGPAEVDVELVFAVDISYSMDTEEQKLQREGYVQALRSEQFLNALKSGATGRIAVAYMQWASEYDQDTLADWTLIDGPESASAFADKLARRRTAARNAHRFGAIDAAAKLFENNGYNSMRQVIDVSGDGRQQQRAPGCCGA